MAEGPATVMPPADGLWRVVAGRQPARGAGRRGRRASHANRFDPLTMSYGVLYFGTDLETCFGETLSRFRPSLEMLALVEHEWQALSFMAVGSVAADWRQRRTVVHVRLPHDLVFVDVESPVTHRFLRRELSLGLSSMGLSDLDVSTVRGPDRRVTQMISEWAYLASTGEDPTYGGIRYESRIRSGWECWALFSTMRSWRSTSSRLGPSPSICRSCSLSRSYSSCRSSDSSDLCGRDSRGRSGGCGHAPFGGVRLRPLQPGAQVLGGFFRSDHVDHDPGAELEACTGGQAGQDVNVPVELAARAVGRGVEDDVVGDVPDALDEGTQGASHCPRDADGLSVEARWRWASWWRGTTRIS